jgi:hypothetical protein
VIRRHLAGLVRTCRGTVSLEMALAGTLMTTMTLGVVGAAMAAWTRDGLQSAAATTARCVALGAPACAAPAAYAVSEASRMVFPGVISAANVTVAQASSCNGATGQYARITIAATHWLGSVLPPSLDTMTLTVTACHLSGT